MGKEEDELALYEYSRRGKTQKVKALLAQGLEPECYHAYDGSTPLLVAARGGHSEVTVALLQAKADITVRTEDGSSALHHSVTGGNAATVAAFLNAGVSANDQNEDGVTPLMLAAHYDRLDITQVLLDAGADPNISVQGWGAALDGAQGAVADLLKSKGARPGNANHMDVVASAAEHFGDGSLEHSEAAEGFKSKAPEAPVAQSPVEASLGHSKRHATPEGTCRFLQRLRCGKGAEPRLFGKTGLHVSPVGFGCHRLGSSASEMDALRASIKLGVNVIDTAPNYSDGVAETTCGRIFEELFEEGTVRREELVVITKVGNIVGSRLDDVKARSSNLDGVVRVRDDVWHCISPDWIKEELTGSLQRMGLECIDVLLLHCPEFATKAGDVDMNEVHIHITRACNYLETEVADGRICRYGITAAFYPLRRSDPQHLVLSTVLESLPPGHHFQVLQFPLNFAEPNSLWQSQCARNPEGNPVAQGASLGPSLVQLCKSHGIATLVNRPLDGIYKELAGSLRFASEVPFGSAMQEEDLDELEDKLTTLCPDLGDASDTVSEELAGKTVRCLAALDSIDCVLVGMHQPPYVISVMRALAQGSVDPEEALNAVKALHNSLEMWFVSASMSEDHGTAKDWRLPMDQKFGVSKL